MSSTNASRLQECDPWEWLAARRIAALDVETIVPGHGEPCGKAYLRERRRSSNWVGLSKLMSTAGSGRTDPKE
jgi:hypothetical protein